MIIFLLHHIILKNLVLKLKKYNLILNKKQVDLYSRFIYGMTHSIFETAV